MKGVCKATSSSQRSYDVDLKVSILEFEVRIQPIQFINWLNTECHVSS